MRKSRNRIMKMKWLVWGCIAASIGILGSCRNKQVQVDIPQLVKTAPVNGHDGMTSVTYPGKIQAASNVKLAFRVAGPIRKIYVNEGQYVKKGQLLAELDPRDYQIQFNATQAEYTQVKGEADRIIELYRRGSVSVNEYDKAVAARKRVTALYNAHRNALNDTRLKAPFDGYVQNKYFNAPEIVNQGTPVVSMIDNDYFEVDVNIPSGDFIRREDFMTFHANADVCPDSILPLELLDITQGANYNQLFTARFRLKRNPVLAPGMSVSVTIGFKPSSEAMSIVPVSALFMKDGQSFVCLGDEPYNVINRSYVENADWLLCEAFCLYEDREVFQPYKKHHSTALDAGRLAAELGVKNLVLYHTEDRNLDTRKQSYMREAAQAFSGTVYVPDDLERINI